MAAAAAAAASAPAAVTIIIRLLAAFRHWSQSVLRRRSWIPTDILVAYGLCDAVVDAAVEDEAAEAPPKKRWNRNGVSLDGPAASAARPKRVAKKPASKIKLEAKAGDEQPTARLQAVEQQSQEDEEEEQSIEQVENDDILATEIEDLHNTIYDEGAPCAGGGVLVQSQTFWQQAHLEIESGILIDEYFPADGTGLGGSQRLPSSSSSSYSMVAKSSASSVAAKVAATSPAVSLVKDAKSPTVSTTCAKTGVNKMCSKAVVKAPAVDSGAEDLWTYSYDDDVGKVYRKPKSKPKSFPDWAETIFASEGAKLSDSAIAQWRDGSCWEISTLTCAEYKAKMAGVKVTRSAKPGAGTGKINSEVSFTGKHSETGDLLRVIFLKAEALVSLREKPVTGGREKQICQVSVAQAGGDKERAHNVVNELGKRYAANEIQRELLFEQRDALLKEIKAAVSAAPKQGKQEKLVDEPPSKKVEAAGKQPVEEKEPQKLDEQEGAEEQEEGAEEEVLTDKDEEVDHEEDAIGSC